MLNKDLNALEQELGAAHRAGTADAFCLYLYGLILTDRHDLLPQPVLSANAGTRLHAWRGVAWRGTGLTQLHTNAGSARLMHRRRSWHQSALTHATGAHGRSALRDCHFHACRVLQPCRRWILCCCCLQPNAASQALATLCGEKDGIRDLTLPQHWMRDFFLAHLCLEMQHNAEGLSRLQVQHAPQDVVLAAVKVLLRAIGMM